MNAGDRVQKGDLLGTIDQAEIRERVEADRRKRNELLLQDREKSDLQSQRIQSQIQQIQLERNTIQLQRQDLQQRIRNAEAKTPVFEERVESRKRLEQLGLVAQLSDERLEAEQRYLENLEKIAEFNSNLKLLESQAKQLESKEKSLALQDLESSSNRKNQIQEIESRMALDTQRLKRDSQILCDYSGTILELTANVGQIIQTRLRLGSIELEDPSRSLVGLTFFPVSDGKKIQPGMSIQITPDTVKPQRYGGILGIVNSVSTFAATKEGATSAVGNPEVVQVLLSQGPQIEVVAQLEPDSSTVSGYKWSSSRGPELPVTPGTTTTARVVVEQRSPISYLLPFLRNASGIY